MKHKNQNYEYLITNKKYLTKINNIFYFSFRYKERVYKYSLKTSNIEKANIKKILLVRRLKMQEIEELNFDIDYCIDGMIEEHFEDRLYRKFGNVSSKKQPEKCSIHINSNSEESDETIRRIEIKILKILQKEYENDKIKSISIEKNVVREKTIKEAFQEYYTYKEREGVSIDSLKSYKTFYKYLLYFCNEDKKVSSFNSMFFSEVLEEIEKIPFEVLRNAFFDNKKIEDIKSYYKDKEYKTLSSKYTNRMFRFFQNLFYFFETKHYIKDSSIIKFVNKKETTAEKKEFDSFELQLLRSAYRSIPLVYDYIAISLYTGLRIQEITLLKKENIDLEKELITIDREMTKTDSGQRIIPIHRDIIEIIKENYYSSIENEHEYIISKTGNVNAITKKINREINKIITSKSKSFHSFRKNFSQQLYYQQQKNYKIDDKTIKALMGHSQNDMTFEVYNKNRIDIEVLREAINSIDYDNARF